MCIYCRHSCGAADSILHQEKAFLPSDALQSMAKMNKQLLQFPQRAAKSCLELYLKTCVAHKQLKICRSL